MTFDIFAKLRHSVAGLLAVAASVLVCLTGPVAAQHSPASSERIWSALKGDVFGDRPILLDTGLVRIEAPKRAQDAALVPVDIFVDRAKGAGIKSLTLIIDVNPSPVAATIRLGSDAGVTHLATRLRVDDYSYLRAIVETESGELHMSKTFVKASGGCSAPAVKNSADALAAMGRMKMRQFGPPAADSMTRIREIQVMIRHPNNSGLQRDPLTQYFIPAHFIQTLSVSQGERAILSLEGGISISEDPNFRFDFVSEGNADIRVEAVDTEGKIFSDQWPLDAGF